METLVKGYQQVQGTKCLFKKLLQRVNIRRNHHRKNSATNCAQQEILIRKKKINSGVRINYQSPARQRPQILHRSIKSGYFSQKMQQSPQRRLSIKGSFSNRCHTENQDCLFQSSVLQRNSFLTTKSYMFSKVDKKIKQVKVVNPKFTHLNSTSRYNRTAVKEKWESRKELANLEEKRTRTQSLTVKKQKSVFEPWDTEMEGE